MILQRQRRTYWLLTFPAIFITLVGLLWPISRGVQISFTNMNLLADTNRYVGLANYGKVLSDPDFYFSLLRNVEYVVVVVFLNFVIGFAMALVCNEKFAGNRVLRAVIILPMVVIPTAAAILWRFMYNYDIGVINNVANSLHLLRVDWLGDPKMALISVLITDIWAWTPWMFLILLAGLEGLPAETIEAARIDGASGLRLIWMIMLPMMRPIYQVAISLKAIDTFRTFDYVWVMTGGGPGSSSDILSTYIYKSAFKNLAYGYSAAISLVVLVFTVALSFSVLRGLIVKQENL